MNNTIYNKEELYFILEAAHAAMLRYKIPETELIRDFFKKTRDALTELEESEE